MFLFAIGNLRISFFYSGETKKCPAPRERMKPGFLPSGDPGGGEPEPGGQWWPRSHLPQGPWVSTFGEGASLCEDLPQDL